MPWSSKNLIFAFPLALDFFRDKRAAKGRFYLRWSDSLENERRSIPSLQKVTRESSVSAEVAFESRVQASAGFDPKRCARILHSNVNQLRAWEIQPWNNNRTLPRAAARLRKIDNHLQFSVGNLHHTFPSATRLVFRAANERGSKN
jgi:hypothetical protein